jgi:hypothetical protein
MESRPRELFLHPKPERISLVCCQFISPDEYAYWFKGKAAGGAVGIKI